MKLRLTKPAQRDFDQAVDWFSAQRPGLADDFLDDLESAFKQIQHAADQLPRVDVSVANSTRQWRRVILRRFSSLSFILLPATRLLSAKSRTPAAIGLHN